MNAAPARDVPLGMLFALYLLMLAAGFITLRLGISMPRGTEITADRAVFMVVNTATLSGFQLSVTPDQYHLPGQIVIFALTIGGSLFSMIVGSAAVVRIARLPYSIRQIVLAAVIVQVSAILIGTLLLGRLGVGAFAAMMQGAGAFGNSGVHIGSLPGIIDWRTHAVLLPLAVLGGLGLAVLMDLGDWFRGRRTLCAHSRVVIVMTAALYLFGMIALLAVQWLTMPEKGPAAFATTAASTSATSLNARTLGLPLQWTATLPRASQWLIILLMIVGASSGGTGGGLKTTTLATLFTGARAALRARRPGRAFGIAIVWLMIYLLIVATALLILLHAAADVEADRLLFLAVSAASNVGLSHDVVTLTGAGLYTLAGAMLGGRIVPLLILWWLATAAPDAELAVG